MKDSFTPGPEGLVVQQDLLEEVLEQEGWMQDHGGDADGYYRADAARLNMLIEQYERSLPC